MTKAKMNALVKSVMTDIEPYLIPRRNVKAYVKRRIVLACSIAERDAVKETMGIYTKSVCEHTFFGSKKGK
jgi:hypothetical protein